MQKTKENVLKFSEEKLQPQRNKAMDWYGIMKIDVMVINYFGTEIVCLGQSAVSSYNSHHLCDIVYMVKKITKPN